VRFSKLFEAGSYLAYHKRLNPKLFDGEVLKSEVRHSLLNIAEEWRKFSKIPSDFISDIIFTGGNANYNYTRFSDIDLHLIVNKKKLGDNSDFIDDYLADKKSLWAAKHHIKVRGYSVEMYAQDEEDNLIASGVYSVLHNKWLFKPVHANYNFSKDEALIAKIAAWKDTIEHLIDQGESWEEFKTIKEKLKAMRSAGLESGEFGLDNLVFKGLRNSGILNKMNRYLGKKEDSELSLD